MGTGSRLALLMLTAILGDFPPGPPPGAPPADAVSVHAAPCPRPNCGGEGESKSGYRYSCYRCGRTFYYCGVCKHHLTRGEVDKHEHVTS
jgi:hypothetical protein